MMKKKVETAACVLENAYLRIVILPDIGGKIVSFYNKKKDFELAAQMDYREKMSYDEDPVDFADYAFGMDDAFPNIDEEKILWKGKELFYPGHGRVWNSRFKVIKTEYEEENLRLSIEMMEGDDSDCGYHYRYVKNYSLSGTTLKMDYRILNTGDDEFPCIWTYHGLVRYDENMEIRYPDGTDCFLNTFSGELLGKEGEKYSIDSGRYDFLHVPKRQSMSMVKYYVDGKVREGKCGIHYPSQDVDYSLSYDKEKLPYLGVWITAGGLDGAFNCALEPADGFYDSISKATNNKALEVLGPGEAKEFSLEIELS